MGTPYRIYDDWSDWDAFSIASFTLDHNTVGVAPWLDDDDDDAGYVEFRRTGVDTQTKQFVIKPPAGTRIASLGWNGDSYDPGGWPGESVRTVGGGTDGFYRFEFIVRLRQQGSAPSFLGLHQMALSDYVGGAWTNVGPFQMSYSTISFDTEWVTLYTGRSEFASTVEGRWQDASDAGNFGFKFTISPSELTYTDLLGYLALIVPRGIAPPLRQNQRDDIRQGQRTSRQLTVRQVGYL